MTTANKPDVAPQIIREVRGFMFRKPVVVFHDRLSIAAMPINKLRALVALGVVSEQRIESLPATAISLPPAKPPRAVSAAVGAGDWVTGTAENHVLRTQATNTVDSGFVSTLAIAGPHILVDVEFRADIEDALTVNHSMHMDIRYAALPITTDAAWNKAQSVFSSVKTGYVTTWPTIPVSLKTPSGAEKSVHHLDVLIDLQQCFYTFKSFTSAGLSNTVAAFLTIRPAVAQQVRTLRPILPTPVAHLTAPPMPAAVASVITRGSSPVVNVFKSPTGVYIAWTGRSGGFIVNEADMSDFVGQWRAIAIVPVSEAMAKANELFMSGLISLPEDVTSFPTYKKIVIGFKTKVVIPRTSIATSPVLRGAIDSEEWYNIRTTQYVYLPVGVSPVDSDWVKTGVSVY